MRVESMMDTVATAFLGLVVVGFCVQEAFPEFELWLGFGLVEFNFHKQRWTSHFLIRIVPWGSLDFGL